MTRSVIVVGAGVAGLSTAIRLAEDPARRFDVRVVADRVAGAALSHVAAASFYPYAVAHPRVDDWLAAGLREFRALANDPATGIRLRETAEVLAAPLPPEAIERYARVVLDHRPTLGRPVGMDPKFEHGHRFVAPIIEMPVYLEYLRRRFDPAGTRIERATLRDLDEVAAPDVIVVNCSGVRARALASDPEVVPSLGQVLRVAAPPEVDEFRMWKGPPGAGLPAYVVPRGADCVLGTIDRPWSADERGFEPPEPDPVVDRDILERCARLDRRIAGAEVLSSECGLRPMRRTVRVELDRAAHAAGRRVVHNYGHGGAGVTLSWGCAEEVRSIAAGLVEGA